MFDAAAVIAQGGRNHMEDFVHLAWNFAGHDDWLYAGVFDGHSGTGVSRRAAEELHGLLAEEILAGHPVTAALPRAFRRFDAAMAAEASGSTAALAVLQERILTVANAGDSHIALVAGASVAVLTADHRLTNETEYRRVVAAGARIWGPYACLPNGSGLMCTRALGDREFRQIGILAEPEVSSRPLAAGDEWIVAATDGVWDGLDPETVGRLARGAKGAREAAERVRDAALAATSDNVSVIAIRLG